MVSMKVYLVAYLCDCSCQCGILLINILMTLPCVTCEIMPLWHQWHLLLGEFTNVLQALQNNFVKTYYDRNHIYFENFKLKLCTSAPSMALSTSTKFQLEIRIRSTISAIYKFGENILGSSWNISEAPPLAMAQCLVTSNHMYRCMVIDIQYIL